MTGQLAVSKSFGLLRIDKVVSDYCIYCTILTGEMRGGITVEYKDTITPIVGTETIKIF